MELQEMLELELEWVLLLLLLQILILLGNQFRETIKKKASMLGFANFIVFIFGFAAAVVGIIYSDWDKMYGWKSLIEITML